MAQIINARWQLRSGTTAQWAANDEVIGAGEVVEEVTVSGRRLWKVGDGVKTFSALLYRISTPMDQTAPTDGQAIVWDATIGKAKWGGAAADIMAGANIAIDKTDPAKPVVSSTLGPIQLKDSVAAYANLPTSPTPAGGDAYYVRADGLVYIYASGVGWPAQGTGIALGGVANRAAAQSAIATIAFPAGAHGCYFDFSDPRSLRNASGSAWTTLDNIFGIASCAGDAVTLSSGVALGSGIDALGRRLWCDLANTSLRGTLPAFAGIFDGNRDRSIVVRAMDYSTAGITPLLVLGTASASACFGLGNNLAANVYNLFQYGADVVKAPALTRVAHVFGGSKAGNVLSLYVDGAIVASATVAAANIATNTLSVGVMNAGATAVPGTIRILGALLVDRCLTTAEIVNIGALM